MDKWFHLTLYNGCNYISMLGLKLNHVSKSGPRYNACIKPIVKQLHLLKIKHVFYAQCLKFWYSLMHKKLPHYFRDMFKHNLELQEIRITNHDRLNLYPTHTIGACDVLRRCISKLLTKFPQYLIERNKTNSIYSISYYIIMQFVIMLLLKIMIMCVLNNFPQ